VNCCIRSSGGISAILAVLAKEGDAAAAAASAASSPSNSAANGYASSGNSSYSPLRFIRRAGSSVVLYSPQPQHNSSSGAAAADSSHSAAVTPMSSPGGGAFGSHSGGTVSTSDAQQHAAEALTEEMRELVEKRFAKGPPAGLLRKALTVTALACHTSSVPKAPLLATLPEELAPAAAALFLSLMRYMGDAPAAPTLAPAGMASSMNAAAAAAASTAAGAEGSSSSSESAAAAAAAAVAAAAAAAAAAALKALVHSAAAGPPVLQEEALCAVLKQTCGCPASGSREAAGYEALSALLAVLPVHSLDACVRAAVWAQLNGARFRADAVGGLALCAHYALSNAASK
jgi:hypothetical protein